MTISFNEVTKNFGRKNVLNKVSFQLHEGKCYGLLGRNGSGKSTIINLIIQFLLPDKGKIEYDNISYTDLPKKVKKEIGLLTENDVLIEALTATEYLQLTGQLYGLKHSVIKKRSAELLDFFYDEHPGNKRIATFSTGMKKMIGICGAIIHHPKLLILDEPFSGLDIIAAKKVTSLLNQYKSPDRTILITSHNLNYLSPIISDVLVLDEGQMKITDTLHNFTKTPHQELETEFLKLFVNENDEEKTIEWI